MKKIKFILMTALLLAALALAVSAADGGPFITAQPQNPVWPEFHTAEYRVEAAGSELVYSWYIVYNGKTYDPDNSYDQQVLRETGIYGCGSGSGESANEFVIAGITSELNGAELYCEITGYGIFGEYGTVKSSVSKLMVGDESEAMPPELHVPASFEVSLNSFTDILVYAEPAEGGKLEYQWYESFSGRLEDIIAVDWHSDIAADKDTLSVDTSEYGTRYYVCMVSEVGGGTAYSNVIPVTVSEPVDTGAPLVRLPSGTAGKYYNYQFALGADNDVYSIYYNPGRPNEFEASRLEMSFDGCVFGVPVNAGEFIFTVCVSDEMSERYYNCTLTVEPAPGFTDISETDWYYNDVNAARATGLINGTTDTTYSPKKNLTYAEAIKLAACIHQLTYSGKITLTNGEPWYQSYVEYASKHGIIDHDYDWTANATRAGYMEIFAGALKDDELAPINSVKDGAIPDVPRTHPQAKSIYKLYRAGIVQGSDAYFNCNPDRFIVRSEVAAVLTRMVDASARKRFSISD